LTLYKGAKIVCYEVVEKGFARKRGRMVLLKAKARRKSNEVCMSDQWIGALLALKRCQEGEESLTKFKHHCQSRTWRGLAYEM